MTMTTLLASSPTRVSDMTRAIMAEYTRSTPAERYAGEHWYPRALAECQSLAAQYGVTLETAVGIVAALSPRQRWARNLVTAETVLAGGTPRGVLGRSLRMAQDVLAGDREPYRVLPLSGPKVWAFFHTIYNAEHACHMDHHVVVDVWAVRVATNGRHDAVAPCRYASVAQAYRNAAERLGVRVDVLQATTWVSYRGKAE